MNRIKVVFRADASTLIGTGHIMRCLTLADALKAHGTECHFICRELQGNMIPHIQSKGYPVHPLVDMAASETDLFRSEGSSDAPQLTHAVWLSATQQQDSDACAPILQELKPDWLVVDHYALDRQWETALQPFYSKLMVIDDLADRAHICDLLLDQNLGRSARDYAKLVPHNCQVLVGPTYALLRPEFAELREYSLRRRADPQLKRLLITMGGVDQYNATGQVLTALNSCELPANCRIIVVMGAAAPWLLEVQAQATSMCWPTEVLVNIDYMAQCMADSDLAIGAAGSSSWERCCLGLPTLMVVLADNQRPGARALHSAQAAYLVGEVRDIEVQLPVQLSALLSERAMQRMGCMATRITDGAGAARVADLLVRAFAA